MWRSIIRQSLVLWGLGAGAAVGLEEEKAWPDDPAVLLEQLKARDAEFDNRTIRVERLWMERVSPRGQIAERRFNAVRFGQPEAGLPANDPVPEDYDQPHRLRLMLTVREPEVTIERVEDLEPMKHPEYTAIPNRGCRWSSAGGVERVWSPETDALHIQGTSSPDGLLRWDEHMIEWCCGYGIGRWTESIDSIRIRGNRLIAKGRMKLLADEEIRVEMQLDRDLVLRSAEISILTKDGGVNEYIVDNEGTERPEGSPPVARSGHFRRVLKPVGKPDELYQDYRIQFLSVSPHLTDAQYTDRTRIEPGPKTTVIDIRSTK